jgi:hypothetical protein
MKSILKLSLAAFLSFVWTSTSAPAETGFSRATGKRAGLFDSIWTQTSHFFRISRTFENEVLFSSIPRITWGQIKAKYRDPNDPKGN